MKKLEGNGLWESSRIILPEHKNAMLHDQQEEMRRERPIVDEQELEVIGRQLQESRDRNQVIKLYLYDPFGEAVYQGIVLYIDAQLGKVKLRWSEDDWDWIWSKDIIRIEE